MRLSKVVGSSSSEGISAYSFEQVQSAARKADILLDVESARRDAYKKGFTFGESAGRESGLQEVASLNLILKNMIQGMTREREKALLGKEADVLRLALATAKRILRHDLSIDPATVTEYIRDAIRKIGHTETLVIRVHPEDLKRLSLKEIDLLREAEGVKWLRFDSDETLLRGECVVESKERMVDARLDSQLSVIERGLAGDAP